MSPEQRIAAVASGLGVAAAVVAWGLRGPATGLAWAVGAGLGLLNYRWLVGGARALLPAAGPVSSAGVRAGALRFLIRFGLLGVALYAIFISHLLPLVPVVLGLFALPLAAVLVALLLLASGD